VGVWLICSVLVFLLFVLSFSFGLAAKDDGIYTYSFHLYFDQGKLVKDRDFETPFDLVAAPFQNPVIPGTAYQGEIFSISDKKLANFSFAVPANGKGKLTVLAPYFDNAKTANFYDPQSQKLLSLDLAPGGPVCNEDGQCQAATGETYLNCPSDCQAPVSPSATPVSSPFPGSKINDNIPLLTGLLVLILIVAIVVVWIWMKRKRAPIGEPPQI